MPFPLYFRQPSSVSRAFAVGIAGAAPEGLSFVGALTGGALAHGLAAERTGGRGRCGRLLLGVANILQSGADHAAARVNGTSETEGTHGT